MSAKILSVTDRQKRMWAARAKRHRERCVNIGDQIQAWNALKMEIGASSDREVAKFLIESHQSSNSRAALLTSGVSTSLVSAENPHLSARGYDYPCGSSAEPSTSGQLSAEGHEPGLPVSSRSEMSAASEGTDDPLGLENTFDESDVDPTYNPKQWELSMLLSDEDEDNSAGEIWSVEDEVLDFDQEAVGSSEAQENTAASGMTCLNWVDEETSMQRKYLIFHSSLLELTTLIPSQQCRKKGCTAPSVRPPAITTNGCAAYLKWFCEKGHEIMRWCSQPMLPGGILLGNLQLCSSVTISGNNFTKIGFFAKCLGLGMPAPSTFSAVQTRLVVPVVDAFWTECLTSALEEYRSSSIAVSGDARLDSPGQCANFATYTMMELTSKQIVAMEVLDKRQTSLKSCLMEAKGFSQALESIEKQGVSVSEVVTDAHPQITALMKREHSTKRHSYDTWHGAKNLGKKLCQAAALRGNSDLKPWLKDIKNHFFYCSENCEGNVDIMKSMWLSILNHVCDIHEWGLGQCQHAPLMDEERTKPWLSASGCAVKALEDIVTNKRFLRTFDYYTSCRTTSELESFHNHILMYAPKRCAFSYPVYKCRCQLAAIDYNHHLSRETLLTKDGTPRYKRTFSKAASIWTVKTVKAPKQYQYVATLQARVAQKLCLEREEPIMRGKRTPQHDDPRLISRTTTAVPPPPTEDIANHTIKRLKKGF